jgi:hypothetical protein
MIIKKDEERELLEIAEDAAEMCECFRVHWTVKRSTINTPETTVQEASFIVLAKSMSAAVMFELSRLMSNQAGRFTVEVDADELDMLDVVTCFREGAECVDIRELQAAEERMQDRIYLQLEKEEIDKRIRERGLWDFNSPGNLEGLEMVREDMRAEIQQEWRERRAAAGKYSHAKARRGTLDGRGGKHGNEVFQAGV